MKGRRAARGWVHVELVHELVGEHRRPGARPGRSIERDRLRDASAESVSSERVERQAGVAAVDRFSPASPAIRRNERRVKKRRCVRVEDAALVVVEPAGGDAGRGVPVAMLGTLAMTVPPAGAVGHRRCSRIARVAHGAR